MAVHDGLTDLPNRTLFHDRAEQAIHEAFRNGTGFAVMLIDLDRFKEVNDTLGHLSGDQMLVEVGTRLRDTLRRVDTVARLGGDEFAVLAPGLDDPVRARLLAEVLRDAIGRPVVLGGLELEMEASVGIAFYPADGTDVETLVRRADVAMYVSKNAHTPVAYAEEFDHNSIARLALVAELRKAIDGNELVIDYQPQSDVATGRVCKLEALLRWEHPKHGLLAPDQFIPFAEETGMIRSLTRYVLDAALHRCRDWQAGANPDVTVAVNITGRDVVDLDFPGEVAGLLAKWQVDPRDLELGDHRADDHVRPAQGESGARGAQRAGSPARDRRLRHRPRVALAPPPASDQRAQHRQVVRAGYGRRPRRRRARAGGDSISGTTWGLEVVAEGVETEEATRRLRALGCDTMQGFHLGRPERHPSVWSAPHDLPSADSL